LESNHRTITKLQPKKSKEVKTILQQPTPNINTEMSGTMQNSVNNAANAQGRNAKAIAAITAQPTPPLFTKRIGSTTYTVSVHFSQTSKETAEDKLLRLIENEVRKSA